MKHNMIFVMFMVLMVSIRNYSQVFFFFLLEHKMELTQHAIEALETSDGITNKIF